MRYLRILAADLRRREVLAKAFIALIVVFTALCAHAQTPWTTVGPDGGVARSFAAVPGHPNHLYLGTTTGWIYESLNGGASWHHLARIGTSHDLVLDHIIVDQDHPSTIYAAGWRPDIDDGGLWISHNAGRTWTDVPGMRGQSIRAFIESPSAPDTFFAGTLDGVFRSTDAGATWKQISPPGSAEIHNVESLAVDPLDPNVLYAGTWHLPWKTTNGGKTWVSIKRGLWSDSDIFSIIVDPFQRHTVYLSACSGVYKSENSGLLFSRIYSIPISAERTQVIKQDPVNTNVVYAGTTNGLYKTENGGRTFHLMTSSTLVVNDIYIDPANPNHVLLATQRGGVLASNNGAVTFAVSNKGISGRKVEALLVDRNHPDTVYAGVVNDQQFGGVFVSHDGGRNWTHIAHGLDGHDVFALAQAQDGTVLAGTDYGIYALSPKRAGTEESSAGAQTATQPEASVWHPINVLNNTLLEATTETIHGLRVNVEKKIKDPVTRLKARVAALDASGNVWLAATSMGLFTSKNKGATWQGGPVMGASDYMSVAVHKGVMMAARPHGLVVSHDGGLTWMPVNLPLMLKRIHCIAFSPDGTLWMGAREGVFFTTDMGKSWKWLQRLPFRGVDDVYYDPMTHRILISSTLSDQIFAIDPKTITWNWYQTGYNVLLVRSTGSRLLAATLTDGVVLQPQPAATEGGTK
jgi:photosystem II stability/assembly factor-like uncharacterized protein